MIDSISESTKSRIGKRTVVASISGGKDSAALSLWLTENGIDHVRVFADTGWESERTVEYIRGELTEKLGFIHEVGVEGGMIGLIRSRGMFPSRLRRFCTSELKVKPIADFLSQYEDPINAVGVRGAESAARSNLPEWEDWGALDCDVWRPLIRWTKDDVIDIHHRNGLRPNPMYLAGYQRVGCYPCIHARKEELRLIANEAPERIELIGDLENEVTEAMQQRAAKKGNQLKLTKATFFHRQGVKPGIKKHAEWARTARGGKQFPLFEEPPMECMRWGMCDAEPEDENKSQDEEES